MKNIEVFKNLSDETYEKLGKILRRRELNKKEVLFLEREVVERVYFIEEGKCWLAIVVGKVVGVVDWGKNYKSV